MLIEISNVSAETHNRLRMLSGTVVRTRSKMLLCLVGYLLIWCKKKSKHTSLNSEDPADMLFPEIACTNVEFHVKSGKLKSPAISILSYFEVSCRNDENKCSRSSRLHLGGR